MDKPLRIFVAPPYSDLSAQVGHGPNASQIATVDLPPEVILPPTDAVTGRSPSQVLVLEVANRNIEVQACSSGVLTTDGFASFNQAGRTTLDLKLHVHAVHQRGEVGELFGTTFPGRGTLSAFVYLNVEIKSAREAILPLLAANAGIDPDDRAQQNELWLRFLEGEGPELFVDVGTPLGRAGRSERVGGRRLGFAVESSTGPVDVIAFFQRMRPLTLDTGSGDALSTLLAGAETDPELEGLDVVEDFRSRVITRAQPGARMEEVTVVLHSFDIATETFDPSELKPEHIARLNLIFALATTDGAYLRVIDIVGNASVPSRDLDQDARNLRYSKNRALAVWLYLKRLGIARRAAKPELELPGFRALGSRRPLVPTSVEEPLNRSVHITYLWAPPLVEPRSSLGVKPPSTTWKLDLRFSVQYSPGGGLSFHDKKSIATLGPTMIGELGTLTKLVEGSPPVVRGVLLVTAGGVLSLGRKGAPEPGLPVGASLDVVGIDDFGVAVDSQFVKLRKDGEIATFETVDFDWFDRRRVYVVGAAAAAALPRFVPGGVGGSAGGNFLLMTTLVGRYPALVGTFFASAAAGSAELGFEAKLVTGLLYVGPNLAADELLSVDSAKRIFETFLHLALIGSPLGPVVEVFELVEDVSDWAEQPWNLPKR